MRKSLLGRLSCPVQPIVYAPTLVEALSRWNTRTGEGEIERLRAERDRETELRRAAELHNRELRAALLQKPFPDEMESLLRERLEKAREVIERLDGINLDDAPFVKAIAAELRSTLTEAPHQ